MTTCTYDTRAGAGRRIMCDHVAAATVVTPDDGPGRYPQYPVCARHLIPMTHRLEGRRFHVTVTARRVNTAAAHAHFRAGGRVVVSVDGGDTLEVGPMTTTHAGDADTWSDLVATVASYGDPRQRFYVVPG